VRFLRGVLSAFCGRLVDAALTIVKAEAAAAYVSCVVKVRRAFIALLSLAMCLLLALSGFVLVHVALFAWLPWSVGVKAPLLLILGAVYLGCGLAMVLRVSSDRAWMRFAKVDRIVASLGARRN
jgi:hypothetical protein